MKHEQTIEEWWEQAREFIAILETFSEDQKRVLLEAIEAQQSGQLSFDEMMAQLETDFPRAA